MTITREQLFSMAPADFVGLLSADMAPVATYTPSSCTKCAQCRYCERCIKCTQCTLCAYCNGCSRCSNSDFCTRCVDCSGCTRCTDCYECVFCRDCVGIKNGFDLQYVVQGIQLTKAQYEEWLRQMRQA